ncbi:MAG: hypothetical protein MI757_04795 [Pirellulales bacterium]|nr:hypothetical protein [Pirellulales bacterium]
MQTLEQIRREGLDALRDRLGQAGMIRFLAQFENGSGDYASERRAWVDETTLDQIRDAAEHAESDGAS